MQLSKVCFCGSGPDACGAPRATHLFLNVRFAYAKRLLLEACSQKTNQTRCVWLIFGGMSRPRHHPCMHHRCAKYYGSRDSRSQHHLHMGPCRQRIIHFSATLSHFLTLRYLRSSKPSIFTRNREHLEHLSARLSLEVARGRPPKIYFSGVALQK